MLIDEMPRSFVKKNNSYSHCPLKKRPVHVMLYDEVPESAKDEIIDVVTDDIPEPENLSTKPEDLSRSAPKRRSVSRSPSPVPHKQPHLDHQIPSSPVAHYPPKPLTPPVGVAPIHPLVKKERVEVIQHDGGAVSTGSMHFMSTKAPLEPLNLNTPVEPVPHYATPAWARAAPLYPPHYLPYPAYRFHHHPGAELYPAYPLPAYPHSPEHASASPPPMQHTALTCPTIQRPIARSYAHWAASSSPDHCGLSPTSSVGYSSLRSPPPVTPEDLSSPGSDSGRSSAGSTSAGSSILMKMDSNTSPIATSNPANQTSASTRYQCPDCGKSYSTYSGLSKHQQFHCAAAEGQTKKSFSCKYCEKVYVSLGALKMHIRTHTLPCKCHLCGKAFSRPWLLQGHIRTHTGEKPFSCQHCNRAFADRSNLRAHLQTHSDVKKYSCTSCSKTFSRMSLLTKHQEGGCPGMNVPIGYGC
ncbi:protein escargot [Diachasma alloeum]|uniref:protein escargot n=1 Tax=Diachasma alloeum TaxID=454923 RepID=UPI000738294F|nr:protein escargot [Diachasma alloeum]